MLFRPDLSEKVERGEKTQTRRAVKPGEVAEYDLVNGTGIVAVRTASGRLKWVVGGTYANQPGRGKKGVGYIRVVGIYRERLQEIEPEDVKAEGFGSLEEFAAAWNEINPRHPYRFEDDPDVWVLAFVRDCPPSAPGPQAPSARPPLAARSPDAVAADAPADGAPKKEMSNP